MTTFGKSIRIYLKDGTVTGIRFGEVVNQTIESIACPRNRVPELRSYESANRPGVYFLFGYDEETGDNKTYIGEAENVFERLQNHYTNKEFWNEVIFFVSKDENLTKSHVKYLESRSIQIATSTKRYKIENGNQSQPSSLPPADRDAMEEFLVYLKLLLGVFGHKLLEELNPVRLKISENSNQLTLTATTQDNQIITTSKTLELSLSANGVKANSIQTDEGIVVLEGSEVVQTFSPSLHLGYQKLREKLINNGTLKLIGNKYVFQKNYLFDAATPAAAIIVGRSISGPQTWKDKNGSSLKDIENLKIIQSPDFTL
ncbi:MAG TPA: GIY-YIG nuclease family protein [Bacteroidia bacterium]|jgi:hypothetical protein|nr:GIY-YIG nuclease family protein [Bacteroidia bacterium]